MNSKLTLTIEDSVIKKAKRYAKSRGRSLSDIIENYLKMITKDYRVMETGLTPTVKSLKGAFKAPEDLDYKKELAKALSDKHVKNG
jgi:predicted CopG family antitoxin